LRAPIERLPVDTIAWTPTPTPGIHERILNVDSVTGARTLLLKSLPRKRVDLGDRRPQVHPVDEEFYCLSGHFTLEGDVWFAKHSYAYYPPGLVHGHGVDVPGGYEIYLRNSGPLSTKRVDAPLSNTLYFADGTETARAPITLVDAGIKLAALRNKPLKSLILLRRATEKTDGAFILNLPRKSRGAWGAARQSGFLEVFVLSGRVEFGAGTCLSTRDYAFFPGGTSIALTGVDAMSTLLMNYVGDDVLVQCADDASIVVEADAVRPRA
jgi:hypothetical protein